MEGERAISLLANWSVPSGKPELPNKLIQKLSTAVNVPWFEDPTAPSNGSEDNRWLMKHDGVINDLNELPNIPDSWEWVREASSENQWIAIRKKMAKNDIERIQSELVSLRAAAETKDVDVIRAAVSEGTALHPEMNKAFKQATDYANLLEEVAKLQEAHIAGLSHEQRQLDCREALSVLSSSRGFIHEHMVINGRKRLASKVIQRLIEAAGDQGMIEKVDEYAKMAESLAF